MKQVWKFNLSSGWSVDMPKGAKILSAAYQGADLCVWAMVDPEKTIKEKRRFAVFGTGHEIDYEDQELIFIDTAFVDDLVFHVFELI